MATRRPSVPKAQFTAGISSSAGKPAKDNVAPGSTPAPGPSAEPTSGGGQPGSGKPVKQGNAKAKERRPASAPQDRSHDDGVIHAAGNSPVPARSFSGRLLVLGLAMGAVTLLLAPNVHTFLEQRAEITALREDIAAKEIQHGAYTSELARWDDPAYIKQQARDRVSMLMPGETGYWVYGANGVEGAAETNDSVEAAKAAASATTAKNASSITVEPWVESLWGAVQKSAQVQAPPPSPTAPASAPAAPAPAAEPAP